MERLVKTARQASGRCDLSILFSIKATIKKSPTAFKAASILEKIFHRTTEVLGNYRFRPPGHFYSPIPSLAEIKRDALQIFGQVPRTIAGIDLHEGEQLTLLNEFLPYYRDLPFPHEKTDGFRYYYGNPNYSYADAVPLHCMIRHLKPKKIIEVGSGFSSCMLLDTNQRFFNSKIKITFIEPYPDLLKSLVEDDEKHCLEIISSRLQDVDPKIFDQLEENDILFIDSTHVSKVNSDVNRIFFEILPRLAPGVHVHFHDIYYPFEYPKDWIYEGRAWNEAYLLRAFLQFNHAYRVVLMNTYLTRYHEPFLQEQMPLWLKNRSGSLWIRRV